MYLRAANLHYSLIIQWDAQDAIYVVTVPELPGCMTHGVTYEEALAQAQDATETCVDGLDPTTLPDTYDPAAPAYPTGTDGVVAQSR